MSQSIKSLAVLGLAGLVSACCAVKEPAEEFVVVEPAPITIEPAYTGKLK